MVKRRVRPALGAAFNEAGKGFQKYFNYMGQRGSKNVQPLAPSNPEGNDTQNDELTQLLLALAQKIR